MSTATSEYRDYLSPLVNRFVAQGRAEGEARGEARGEANALLAVLAARGIAVPDDVRSRITECDDADQLNAWISRAATAATLDEVLAS